MKFLQFLALGLASANTVAASKCRPSLPVSVSSVSSPSSSPSPSNSAAPQPVCVRNVVTNGYFDSGSLDGWSTTAFNGGTVTGSAGDCGQFASCATLNTVTGGYVALYQTVPNIGVGLMYTFAFDFRSIGALSSDAVLVCKINSGADGLSWTFTPNNIPSQGGWSYFMTTFEAKTTSAEVYCSVSGSYENKVQLVFLSLNC